MLEHTDGPLYADYDLAMLDLDGVVYIGRHAVPGAAAHIARARAEGMHVAFVTNNASRTPEAVAAHLGELGVEAAPQDVVSSAQAAAHLLAGMLGEGAAVFLLGGDGLASALEAEGLRPVTRLKDDPRAVVTGYGPDVPWRRLMRGAVLIRDGLPWVASNTDMTVPMEYGLGPGHGVQVRMLADFSGVTPTVAGKPARPLLDETVRRVGGERPLMVGDRLDTDIEGAHNAGVDSLLVMTGVTRPADLVAARPRHRPTYLSATLGGLFTAHPSVAVEGDSVRTGMWRAEVVGRRVRVERAHAGGAGDEDDVDDWWRVVAAAGWHLLDTTGRVADVSGLTPPPA
jgi:HAD superfamily hydrolase (TIGR01450 family)